MIHQEIFHATKNVTGWCDPAKQVVLACYVTALRTKCVVEVGVWGGRSFIPMVLALQRMGGPYRAYAIDPWKPIESIKGQDGENVKWWGEQNHEAIYQHFIKHLNDLNLLGMVTIIRDASSNVQPPRDIDLFHCDGNHGPQALDDVQRYCPNIRPGGLCIMDDLNWSGGNVGKAAEWLKANGFIELHPLGTGAVFLKL